MSRSRLRTRLLVAAAPACIVVISAIAEKLGCHGAFINGMMLAGAFSAVALLWALCRTFGAIETLTVAPMMLVLLVLVLAMAESKDRRRKEAEIQRGLYLIGQEAMQAMDDEEAAGAVRHEAPLSPILIGSDIVAVCRDGTWVIRTRQDRRLHVIQTGRGAGACRRSPW